MADLPMESEPVQIIPAGSEPTGAVTVEEAAALLRKARNPEKIVQKQEEPADDEPEELDDGAGEEPGDTEEIDDDGDLDTEEDDSTPSDNPPPKSWSEADKELWASLTPDVQQKLLTREKQREAGIQKQLNTVAAERKALVDQTQALELRIKNERQSLNAALQNTQSGIIARLKTEFADVDPRDPASLAKLASEDPGRKVLFDTLWQQLGAAGHQARQIEAAHQAEQQAEMEQFAAVRANELLELEPSLADPAKQQEFETEVIGYLTKNHKVNPERINMYTASELILANKARLYDKAIAARKAREKSGHAATTQAVVKAGQPREGGKSQKVTVLEKQARKSGRVEDIMKLYKAQRAG